MHAFCPPELRRFTQASVLPSILDKIGKDAVIVFSFSPGVVFVPRFPQVSAR